MPMPLAHGAFALAAMDVVAWGCEHSGEVAVERGAGSDVLLECVGRLAPRQHLISPHLFILVLLIACQVPDGIDKPLYYARRTCCTRTYGHTLLCTLLLALAGYIMFGAAVSVALVVGHGSHLLIDRVFGHVPFLWPLQKFRHPSMIHTIHSKALISALEVIAFPYIIYRVDPLDLLEAVAMLL
mmetsp:Transcript_9698/g.27216  ORF Transcript_9698/g.27216 Transcript_9698/m.27216 type:complete len:184 (+) Transcript_9698:106-657(+)